MKKPQVFLLFCVYCSGIFLLNFLPAVSCFASDDNTPVLHDPFDRANPVVKLPGMALTYVRGQDRGDTAIFFDGKTYLREPALTFVTGGKNWIEGTVSFRIKPAAYPPAPNNAPIILFNWNDYPKPQAGYVGDISLTPQGRIVDHCGWEWGGGNPPNITSSSSAPVGVWTHIAIAWSKTEGYTRIYINDKLDAEIEMYCAPGSNGMIYPWLAGYGGYHGALDDLKIYRTAISPPFTGRPPVQVAGKPIQPYIPKPETSAISAGEDIRQIPSFPTVARSNDFAVIIGIENYQSLPSSEYSGSDAGLMKDYLKALGFQERNIEFITNEKATKSSIEKSIEAWLPNRVKKDSRVFVYYSGHGAPDPSRGEAYIVPYDGDPNYLPFTGYALNRLYAKLGVLPAAEVIIVLDSCFSGSGGRSVLAKGARPLVLMAPPEIQSSRLAVLSATQGSQISTSSPQKGHGVFTYYFLKAIKDGKKNLAEIYEHIRPQVEDEAKQQNVQQSPSLSPDVAKIKNRFSLRK